ncbi:MAG: chromate transporter [Candidatus Omnitrophota bacterium]|nr:chromate transporter [Candidatus Omnitrophota bacterium]
MILARLFISFLKIGLLAVGGAYSFLPLLEKEIVEKYHWLAKDEFLDVMATVKIFPGAISIKYATYTGYKLSGILGAIAANLGNLAGPAILIIFAAGLYDKYKNLPIVTGAFKMVELAIFSMLIALAFQLIDIGQLVHPKNLLVVVLSFILFAFTKVNPALILIGAAVLGAL